MKPAVCAVCVAGRNVEFIEGGIINLSNNERIKLKKLKLKVREAKEHFNKANNDLVELFKAYTHLKAKTSELREEWLSLCALMKNRNNKSYGHLDNNKLCATMALLTKRSDLL